MPNKHRTENVVILCTERCRWVLVIWQHVVIIALLERQTFFYRRWRTQKKLNNFFLLSEWIFLLQQLISLPKLQRIASMRAAAPPKNDKVQKTEKLQKHCNLLFVGGRESLHPFERWRQKLQEEEKLLKSDNNCKTSSENKSPAINSISVAVEGKFAVVIVAISIRFRNEIQNRFTLSRKFSFSFSFTRYKN